VEECIADPTAGDSARDGRQHDEEEVVDAE